MRRAYIRISTPDIAAGSMSACVAVAVQSCSIDRPTIYLKRRAACLRLPLWRQLESVCTRFLSDSVWPRRQWQLLCPGSVQFEACGQIHKLCIVNYKLIAGSAWQDSAHARGHDQLDAVCRGTSHVVLGVCE